MRRSRAPRTAAEREPRPVPPVEEAALAAVEPRVPVGRADRRGKRREVGLDLGDAPLGQRGAERVADAGSQKR